MKRLSLIAGILLALAANVGAATTGFYSSMLERGRMEFDRGDYVRAVDQLRIAAFGLLDDVQQFETAQIYLTLALERTGDEAEAKKVFTQLLQAERITPMYAKLELPPAIRSSFEASAAKLATPAQLSAFQGTAAKPAAAAPSAATPTAAPAATTAPSAATPAATAAPSAATPAATAAPAAAKPPTTTTTSSGSGQGAAVAATAVVAGAAVAANAAPAPPKSEMSTLETLVQQSPDSVPLRAALAQAYCENGRNADARAQAQAVLKLDPKNSSALLVTGLVAAREEKWPEVIESISPLRGVVTLNDDQTAALFVALVNTGRYSDAQAMRPSLSEAVQKQPAVQKALVSLQGTTVPSAAQPKPDASGASRSQPPPATASVKAPAPVPPAPSSPSNTTPNAAAAVAAPKPASTPAPKPASAQPSSAVASSPTKAPAATAAPGVATGSQPTKAAQTTPVPAASQPAATGKASDVDVLLADASRSLAEGRFLRAKEIYAQLSRTPSMTREQTLTLAQGLSQTGAFAESQAAYGRAGRLKKGEEIHLFRKAVNYFEAGDYQHASEYLQLALPHIPMTREVADYKSKITAAAAR